MTRVYGIADMYNYNVVSDWEHDDKEFIVIYAAQLE